MISKFVNKIETISPLRERNSISKIALRVNKALKVRHKPSASRTTPSTMYQFKVITQPTSDTTQPSLLLMANNKRYIFGGVPEGTQRAVNQQKLKVSKLSAIFLSGALNWDKVGGLPGLILTVSDQGTDKLTLVNGSTVLDYIISSWRNFIFRFGMNLSSNILRPGESFEEESMKVESINLEESSDEGDSIFNALQNEKLKKIVGQMFPVSAQIEKTEGMDNEEAGNIRQQQDDSNVFKKYIHLKLPSFKSPKISTCYKIQFAPTRGKFQIEKAKKLNIADKKLYGQLAAGKSVTLADGRVINPEDVLSESRMFQKIILVDLPSIDYLPSAYKANWGDNVGLVFHFLGESIEPFSQSYTTFIESFGPGCRHYISHPRYSPDSIVFESSALTSLKLKSLLIDQFNIASSSDAKQSFPDTTSNNVKLFLKGQTLDVISSTQDTPNEIQLTEPGKGGAFDWENLYKTEVIPLDLGLRYTQDQILNKESVSKKSVSKDYSLVDQVETITLGTGSALPSKYRNVISSLVRIPFEDENGVRYRSVLLDAGENTLGSIKRMLGNENLETYFQELKMIYLSHLHADHHLGIVSIIKEWYKYNSNNNERLYLVTPWQYNHFIDEWFNVEADRAVVDRITYISCENFLVGKERKEIEPIDFDSYEIGTEAEKVWPKKIPVRNYDAISALYHDLGIKKLSTCRAIHCIWAYSCSITFKTSDNEVESLFKVSYSGDTRPNIFSFAEGIGKGSDLLIHEATLENEMVQEAKLKRHCTINEAIEVSNKMNAKKLILTHFSQRYPKLPEISFNTAIESEYCYAFDGMIVRYKQIGDQLEVFDKIKAAFEKEQKGVEEGGEND